MKKLILVSACVAAFACPVFAQTPGQIFEAAAGLYRDANRQPRSPNRPIPRSVDYTLPSPLAIAFLSPAQGSSVKSRFTLEGVTSPYNVVDVTVDRVARNGGRGGRRDQHSRSSATADRAGRFAINVDASRIPKHGQMVLHAQASDSRGNQGPMHALQLVRR